MPAVSKKQQQFFGVVKAMQSGDIPKKGAAGKVASDMSKKEVDKYASTKHKGLPSKVREDIDIGHKDDEAGMLKADLYQLASYAADLYKIVDAIQRAENDVDFPHWWQSKIIKAKTYISDAKHYLQNELAIGASITHEHKKSPNKRRLYEQRALRKSIRKTVKALILAESKKIK
jgi:hypothetical protein